MSGVAERAFAALVEAGARLEPGLTEAERVDVEARWGFRFCDDHAAMLALGVPVGDGWLDWRDDPEIIVRARLDLPVDGLLFDVGHNGFWPASWGERPAAAAAAEAAAREQLARWPRLVPLYGHRYVPAGPCPAPAPVLSVVQSDVIFYGPDLHDWVRREFFGVPLPPASRRPEVGEWSRLAGGCEDCDL